MKKMRKLYKAFLGENITEGYLNEKFDYNFNHMCNEETFYNEYRKFLGIYNNFFYNKNRFVCIFNSYEIRIQINDLDQLIKLYIYSKEKNLEKESYILLDFLYTYNNTINSNDYKKNYSKYKESKKDFEDLLNKHSLKKYFYSNATVILKQFYKELILFALDNDIYIDGELIDRVFNNLKKNEEYSNELIDILINNKKNICNIIKYDKEKSKHLYIYFEYISNSLENFGGYNYAKEIFFELDKSKCINNEFTRKVINKYVDVVNDFYKQYRDKQNGFIQGLSEVENLKNELNYILKNITILTYNEKNKIKECLKKILHIKRILVSDDEYLKDGMREVTFEETIKKEDIDKVKNGLLNNEYALYSASKLDFTKQIENALQLYAKYPLQSLVSNYKIDSNKSVYSVGIEDRSKMSNDNFKKYFDEIGKEYTKKHKKLLNKLSYNYYEEFLKYLSKTFNMQQHLIISIVKKEEFKEIINKLKKNVNYSYDNDYAVVANNILAIESNIITFIEKKGLNKRDSGFQNINYLMEIYSKDKDVANGLMYLNYILYEKSGLNLRNYILHGTLINSNLDIPLLVTFSGLIFVSWLLNGK